MKKVYIVADDGSEHPANFPLDGLESFAETKEALAELVAEVLDYESIVADDLVIELRDSLGRTKPLLASMPISAVMRAPALRVRSQKMPF